MYIFPLMMIYFFFMIFGTFVTIMSSSMVGMWVGLEMNLMAFIPMISMGGEGKKSSEACIKYFLIQSVASSLIIFSCIWFILFLNSYLIEGFSYLLILSLGMKMGLAPLHFWFPEVMEGLSWINCLLIMTWQKISPLVIMSLIFKSSFLMLLGTISALMGAISGLNQTSLRKIMAFSSIAHLGWMTNIMANNSFFWINYYIMYSLINFIICFSFWFFSLNFLSQIFFQKDNWTKIIIFVNLLSLGGLPPLLGFLPKLYGFLALSNNFLLLMMLIFSSLITLYFYTRLCLSVFTLSEMSFPLSLKLASKKNLIFNSSVMIFSTLGLIPFMMMI
uniref:NADH dehydrogenase subunit 2 n=1 Tax=Paralepas cf. quadrata TaxID=2977351 RepID=UPI0021CCFE1C|nr:NADH dehydrogenase subunit 2 [Paralepas cf. quadrata]UWM12973.1 NADH dehydrogenase subunit 2 [Paralepas cf. quadrata]